MSHPATRDNAEAALAEILEQFVACRPYAGVTIHAKSVGTISCAGDRALPLASVIKVPVSMALTELEHSLPQSDFDYPIFRSRWPSLSSVLPTHRISIGAHIALMLCVSDNAAAERARQLSHDATNGLLGRLGCKDTSLQTGFTDDQVATSLFRENLGTSHDMMTLLRALHKDPRYNYVRSCLYNNIVRGRLGSDLPDDISFAHKTGTLYPSVVNDIGWIDMPSTEPAFVAALCAKEESVQEAESAISELAGKVWRICADVEVYGR